MKKMVLLGSGVVAALLMTGCASSPPVMEMASGGERSMQFACGNGDRVEMQFLPEQGMGVLVRNGWTVGLPAQPTASGYAYSNGPTTVLGKGNELTIHIGHLAPIWCRSNRGMMVAGAK